VVTIKKYDLQGNEVEEITVEDSLLDIPVNKQMLKNYILAIRNNKRQWSANTKDKSEVKATGKKPHNQKGLGRARQGSLVSPQFKGGGRAHGPKPKFDQHIKINKKERIKSIQSLLAERIREKKVFLLEDLVKECKTKTFFDFLNKMGLIDKRILFLGSKKNDIEILKKSIRNIEKNNFSYVFNLDGYKLALCMHIVMVGDAFKEVLEFLKRDRK